MSKYFDNVHAEPKSNSIVNQVLFHKLYKSLFYFPWDLNPYFNHEKIKS